MQTPCSWCIHYAHTMRCVNQHSVETCKSLICGVGSAPKSKGGVLVERHLPFALLRSMVGRSCVVESRGTVLEVFSLRQNRKCSQGAIRVFAGLQPLTLSTLVRGSLAVSDAVRNIF
jgi:hypothetical protein